MVFREEEVIENLEQTLTYMLAKDTGDEGVMGKFQDRNVEGQANTFPQKTEGA